MMKVYLKRFSIISMVLLIIFSACKKESTPPTPEQECLPSLSLDLSDLQNTGDTIIVNYEVTGEGGFSVQEIVLTGPNGLETNTNPNIPFNQQVIFFNSPPSGTTSADLLSMGKISGSGKIETAISYQLKLKRSGNNINHGGVIRDKCQIN